MARAQLHYSLSDYSNALDMLGGIASLAELQSSSSAAASSAWAGEEQAAAATVYFNNLGCVHYRMKKFNAAAYYFGKALAADEKANHSRSSQRSCEALYNLGLALSVLGKPQLAFDCFQEALQVSFVFLSPSF